MTVWQYIIYCTIQQRMPTGWVMTSSVSVLSWGCSSLAQKNKPAVPVVSKLVSQLRRRCRVGTVRMEGTQEKLYSTKKCTLFIYSSKRLQMCFTKKVQECWFHRTSVYCPFGILGLIVWHSLVAMREAGVIDWLWIRTTVACRLLRDLAVQAATLPFLNWSPQNLRAQTLQPHWKIIPKSKENPCVQASRRRLAHSFISVSSALFFFT